ncbi:MAG TPA: helix-turn-helix transcriptional regulator [Conexibacter sp.]|nr:helix-turn-helix transcriptional regulator [Conexibacter sp.]
MPDQPTSSRIHSAPAVVLGAAVRELRACRDISQEELGFRARLHRNYVGAIERGEINPTFRTLVTLANGLDVELSGLIRLYEEREEDVRA